jgi:hypothetical protein
MICDSGNRLTSVIKKATVPREPHNPPVNREQIHFVAGTKGLAQKVTIVVLWAMTQRSFFASFLMFRRNLLLSPSENLKCHSVQRT